ncbi:DUF4097 family beta strand repeat-containing protein [Actinocatenispora sera]|uniref:DUF4097 family beta strand repeat-containing protein n=1 Tax=Actinocatenispora sera TaxID=390989 RepID=UPI0033D0593E
MRQQLRCLAVTGLAAITVAGLAACGMVTGTTFEDDSTLPGKIVAIRIANGTGSVTVHGTDSGKPSLHRKVRYRADKPTGATHRTENGVLVLGGCGDLCSVSYTVDVPAGVPVRGRVSSGRVQLTDVGAVRVTTSSGRIDLNGVSGTVAVQTTNGGITGSGIEGGKIQAETSNGAIDLTPATPLDVQARTSNGRITLTMPKAAYHVTADTRHGSRNIEVPDDPSAPHRISLSTSNGRITVTTR